MSDDMDATPPPSAPAQGPSPRRFAGALLSLLHSHLALFGEELKEQQNSALRLFVLISLSLLFGLLLVIGLSAALLIVFWDSHRLLVIMILCAVHVLGLLTCLLCLRTQLRNAPHRSAPALTSWPATASN